MTYDEAYSFLHRYSTDQPPYDYVGVIHLLGACLDNLHKHALDAELEEICNCLSEDQIAFLKRLAHIAEKYPATEEEA